MKFAVCWHPTIKFYMNLLLLIFTPINLLAPTGALVLMMVRDISAAAAAAATFSDFEHLCLSILLQVSLYVA